jgi:hypothetical protein
VFSRVYANKFVNAKQGRERGCYGTGGQAPREVQSRIKSSMSVEETRSDSSDLSLHGLG